MDYQARLLQHLIRYKRSVLRIREPGTFRYRGRDVPKDHVLPLAKKWANLIGPTRSLVETYLVDHPDVRPHRYFHHLNSSQAFAFNLFFPFFGGGPVASRALLRALGQAEPLESWEPEAVPDKDEGTNLDACWRLAGGTVVMCEVKLSEADFGKASADERHRRKLRDLYRPVLKGHVAASMLEEPSFFRAYQILRNVWHMLSVPGSRLVFVLPRGNARLWAELVPTLASLTPAARDRVSIAAIEDVLASLQVDAQCPVPLRGYARLLADKYLVGVSGLNGE